MQRQEPTLNTYLRGIDDLPVCFRPCFAGSFRYFNSIQSECFEALFRNDHSVIIAAPTGGGKTVALELAILRLLSRYIDPVSGQFHHRPGLLKVIYLAPAKALVSEKVQEWKARFGSHLGVKIKELTGDSEQDDLAGIDSTDVICTTPEKFDAMTRRHRDRGSMGFFNEIALVLIDEVHLLSESRGSALEAGVVSRIKMVSIKPEMVGHPISSVRFLAVSATVPNAVDLATWLGVPPQGIKVFGDELRPVPLRTIVKGYSKTTNTSDFIFDRRLNDHVWGILNEFSRGRPALVFCPSRAGTATTAAQVAREASRAAAGSRPSILLRDPAHHNRLVQAAATLGDAQLKECIAAGVGYHHAAMPPDERTAVESLFRAGDLLVLCCTSTLAVGVNLPAFLVVIKGTRRYVGIKSKDPGGYDEYERSTTLQMVGRAGRPQFDTEGCAVIMTEQTQVQRYLQLVNNAEPVESTLRPALPEYLNAEITLGTVNDIGAAISWLRSTYFYVRARTDPGKYGVPRSAHRDQAALDQWLRDELLISTLRQLAQHGLVRFDEDGVAVESLQPGVIMAENYVRLPTMIHLLACPAAAGVRDLLWVLAKSSELSGIKLRRGEKKTLNVCNKSESLRHHVMSLQRPDRVADRVSTGADKIFVLINCSLADEPPVKLEYALKQDAEQALTVGARLATAMVRYFIQQQRAAETFNALVLSKSLRQRMWTGSKLEARQLPGVGAVLAERLAANDIRTLKQLAATEDRRLEALAQRAYPWGTQIHDALRRNLPPELELVCTPMAWAHDGGIELQISLTRKDAENPGTEPHGAARIRSERCPMRIVVGTVQDNALLACRSICAFNFASPLVFTVRTRAAVTTSRTKIIASAIHERYIGVDTMVVTVVPTGARLGGRTAPTAPLAGEGEPEPAGASCGQGVGRACAVVPSDVASTCHQHSARKQGEKAAAPREQRTSKTPCSKAHPDQAGSAMPSASDNRVPTKRQEEPDAAQARAFMKRKLQTIHDASSTPASKRNRMQSQHAAGQPHQVHGNTGTALAEQQVNSNDATLNLAAPPNGPRASAFTPATESPDDITPIKPSRLIPLLNSGQKRAQTVITSNTVLLPNSLKASPYAKFAFGASRVEPDRRSEGTAPSALAPRPAPVAATQDLKQQRPRPRSMEVSQTQQQLRIKAKRSKAKGLSSMTWLSAKYAAALAGIEDEKNEKKHESVNVAIGEGKVSPANLSGAVGGASELDDALADALSFW